MLGLCVQHSSEWDIKFKDVDNVQAVSEWLAKQDGGVHLGGECTVVSVSAMGKRPNHALPLVAFSTCKASNGAQHELALNMVRIRSAAVACYTHVLSITLRLATYSVVMTTVYFLYMQCTSPGFGV